MAIGIHSLGAWKFPFGDAQPTITLLIPVFCSSAGTYGMLPPDRWNTGALPNAFSEARAAAPTAGWSMGVIAGQPLDSDFTLDLHRRRGDALQVLDHQLLDLARILVRHQPGAQLGAPRSRG